MPWLLLAALLLALADTLIGLQLRGLLLAPRHATAAAALGALLLVSGAGSPTRAQDEAIIAATAETRLAYVLTGLDEVDELSRAGLEGLSLVLNRRTAIETGDPRGVNLAVDDLNLFPLLYWPIPCRASGSAPAAWRAARRLSAPGRHDPVRHRATPAC